MIAETRSPVVVRSSDLGSLRPRRVPRPPIPVRSSAHVSPARSANPLLIRRCGHCKALAPAWNELGDAYPDTGSVVIGDVDCTVEESLCSEYEVRGYPTLKYFTAETGKEGAPYEGGRALDDLKSFVEEKLEIKCAVDDVMQCSEKEQAYIEKMKAKSPEEVDAALKRLDGMIGGSMKPELKQWIVQRARILRQMQSA